MNLLEEYKNMTTSDKNEFLSLLKKDLDRANNKCTYSDLIEKLKKENIDIDLYFNLIKHSDEVINIADSLKEISKKEEN